MDIQLTDKQWKEYYINDLFEVSGTKTTPLKELQNKNETDSYYPYVTTKSDFMGIDGFYRYFTEEGGVIVIDSATDGHVHYIWTNFSSSDHVEKLTPKFEINKYIGFFIVSMIKFASKGKFNYGYKFSQSRIRRQKIMLPINEKNEPDYKFMSEYMEHLEKEQIKKYTTYLENSVDTIGGGQKTLDNTEYGEFYLNDVFEDIQRGKRLTKANFITGETPYVSSSAESNGIDAFIGNEEKVRIFEDCITLANSGSVGSTFYHPYKFVASDHVTHLKHDSFNKYIYLFLASIIKRLKSKYNFNREINDNRLKREVIILPITENGDIDYKFIEEYMMNLEAEMINKYLKYLKGES